MTAIRPEPASPVIPQARPEPQARMPAKDAGLASPDAVEPFKAGDGTDPRAAAEAVAKAFAGSKDLEVSSFHDEGTGRYVTRVADRWSGRVLLQTPPDQLLRFLASGPELDPPPTMIDA